MQKLFTTAFIKENCGCYTQDHLRGVYKENKKDCFEEVLCDISIEDILDSNIPLKDKYWFFCKKVFTKEQNQQVAIAIAEIVLSIYEEKYPESKAPREAIEAAKLYIKGHISLKELLIKRRAATAAAYAAAAAADTAAAAADTAAYAAAAYAAAAAADTAADTAYAAAYAADTAYAAAAYAAADYKILLLDYLKQFCKDN